MINRRQLSNGITVVFEKMPYLRSAAFGIWIKVGSSNENKKNNGIAHVIEHMMFKGTTKRNSKQIADDMARIGGDINAYTSKECTSFYAVTLDEHLPIAIEILGDMLCNSLIDEASLEKEKSVILEEIDMYDDSPDDLVHEMLQMKVWKNHPLGFQISGTKKVVLSITRDDILEFMKKYYVSGNMVISVAGNFNEDEIMNELETHFSKIPVGNKQEACSVPIYNKAIYKKKKDVEQLHLTLGFDCIVSESEEKYPLTLFNSVYGSSINSRLFHIIRETHGLTYSIYSYTSIHEQAGLFHIYGAMNPSQVEPVIEYTFGILDDIKKNGITKEEFSMAKEQIKTELIMGNESAKNRMNSNGKSILFRDFLTPLEETIDKVNRVELEHITAIANKYLKREDVSMSFVGNLKVGKIDLNSL